jgi:dihydropteroate synthase
MDRTIPVIEALSKEVEVPISIDTVKSSVARAALDAGASIINDISAFEKDPEMADLAALSGAPVILMHMKGTPETMQINPSYEDLMGEITNYLSSRVDFAVEKGVAREKIILDPGIGFGKTVAHNLVLIKELQRLLDLGFPVLMGPSRKSFIQTILTQTTDTAAGPRDNRTETGTLAAVAASLMNGAHIVRVHDVETLSPFVRIIDAVRNA